MSARAVAGNRKNGRIRTACMDRLERRLPAGVGREEVSCAMLLVLYAKRQRAEFFTAP